MRCFLAALMLCLIASGADARRWHHHRAQAWASYSSAPAFVPPTFGDQQQPRRRYHMRHQPRRQDQVRAVAQVRVIERLKNDLRERDRKFAALDRTVTEFKRELDEFKALIGSPNAIVATRTPPLSAYGLMPLPDVRAAAVAFPEPVGPSTAALPIVTSSLPLDAPRLPSEHSRLVLGAGGGVNRKLIAVLHEASRSLPEGYTARIESGVRKRGRGYHPRGLAADVRIYDEHGHPIGGRTGWYQSPRTFRSYEQFAQAAKIAQMRLYPAASFVWGGYFRNGGPGSYGFADLMHMQWGGPMGGGSWSAGATGITRKWLVAHGGDSKGMSLSARLVAAVNDNAEPAKRKRSRREARAR